MSRSKGSGEPLHVLTLTPFFPSDKNEVSGCFVAEPIEEFHNFQIDSSVIAVSPLHHPRKYSGTANAQWLRYPGFPGVFGLSSAGKFLHKRLVSRVRKLHSTKPIDVIHAHAALPCGHAAALISKCLRIPFVVTVHGLDVFNACAQGGTPAKWRRQRSLEVYAAAKTVICISRKVQEILEKGMPGEIRSAIVHNGVNPTLFSPASDEGRLPEILVVGILVPSKGHELVLRALGKLKHAFPEVRCRIIGEGPCRRQFESLVRDLKLEQHVQFVGRQSRVEVAEAMRRCSVFVLPSWNEALGCVYLEAMSCGKPVVACRGQGIDGVIEHGRNGWLVGPSDVEGLVQGLASFLGSPELRHGIGMAARQTILEGFTLLRQAEKLSEVYREAIT